MVSHVKASTTRYYTIWKWVQTLCTNSIPNYAITMHYHTPIHRPISLRFARAATPIPSRPSLEDAIALSAENFVEDVYFSIFEIDDHGLTWHCLLCACSGQRGDFKMGHTKFTQRVDTDLYVDVFTPSTEISGTEVKLFLAEYREALLKHAIDQHGIVDASSCPFGLDHIRSPMWWMTKQRCEGYRTTR